MDKNITEIRDKFQALQRNFNVSENWTSEESIARMKNGTAVPLDEVLAAHVHFGRNGFAQYCAQIGITTRQARKTLNEIYGFSWQLMKPCKKKPKPIRNKPSVKLHRAMKWLETFLNTNGGDPIPAKKCFLYGRTQAISNRTLMRAKEALLVKSYRRNGRWVWYKES